MTVDERDFDRRASLRAALLGERALDVDAVLCEQDDAVALVVDDRPREQAPQHFCWRLEGLAEQPVPGATCVTSEAVLEEQHEVVVVRREHSVVKRLPVVGVCS